VYDENDIPFNDYSLDFFGFIDYAFSWLFGGLGGIGENNGVLTGNTTWSPGEIFIWLSNIWNTLVVLSWMVSAALIFGLIYAYLRHGQLGDVISEILKKQEEAYAKVNKKDVKNLRWQDVQTHAASERSNDWKLAIIEADILLDELLNTLGYAGNTIGEKLKSVSPNSFQTVNQAWRAHNVRNRVAHEGANFELSKKEAQEVITQYKMVFDEFDFI
jgi:hypothetical protein